MALFWQFLGFCLLDDYLISYQVLLGVCKMITKLIIDFLLLLPNALLDLVPHLEIAIPDGVFNSLNNILGLLGFVFPVKGLLVIITTSISIKLFHIVWALILRIKSFIPTEGN